MRRDAADLAAVGGDWSQHPFDRLRTWELRRPALPCARDVGRSTRYGMMAGAVVNRIVHHDQNGFTMRAFQIAGPGRVPQLVDREDVADYCEPGAEVPVHRDVDEADGTLRRVLCEPARGGDSADAGRTRTLSARPLTHRVRGLEAMWTA